MKRVILIFLITLIGICASFIDAYWGLLVYTWYSFASPLELTFGELSGNRFSFVVGLVLVATTIQQRRKLIVSHRTGLLSFFFILQCCCSLAYSGQFSLRFIFEEVELIAKVVLITFLTPVLLDSLPRLRGYVLTVAISSGLLGAYYGIFGFLAGSRQIVGPGRIGDNNAYAVTLVVTLAFIFYAGRYLQLNIPRAILGVGTLAVFTSNLLAVIVTFSRGGFLSALTVILAILTRLRSAFGRLIGWGVLCPIIIIAMWTFVQRDPDSGLIPRERASSGSSIEATADDYLDRLMTIRRNPQNEGSAAGRLHFWKVAMRMVQASPIFGVGLGRYRAEYDKFDFSKGQFGSSRAVHNTFFSIAAELGAIGFLLFIGIIISTVLSLFNARRLAMRIITDPAASREIRDYVDMTIIGLLGFIVGSCFVTTFYQEIFWALISLSVSLELLAENRLQLESKA